MKTILVANPKGGAGKTTLAVNLAGALATAGASVALWDLDRQKSALQWLDVRGGQGARIERLDARGRDAVAVDKRAEWLVMDSPAGLHGKNLEHAIRLADTVLIPVQPSLFDMAATSDFLRSLLAERGKKARSLAIGIVGMRVDVRTRAASTLEAFLSQFDLPVTAYLRDTQLYANAAFNGLTIFDLPDYLARREAIQWKELLGWLGVEHPSIMMD